MNVLEKIYGGIFYGAISVAFFYLTVFLWKENLALSLVTGFFGIIFILYVGLFLLPEKNPFKKKNKK